MGRYQLYCSLLHFAAVVGLLARIFLVEEQHQEQLLQQFKKSFLMPIVSPHLQGFFSKLLPRKSFSSVLVFRPHSTRSFPKTAKSVRDCDECSLGVSGSLTAATRPARLFPAVYIKNKLVSACLWACKTCSLNIQPLSHGQCLPIPAKCNQFDLRFIEFTCQHEKFSKFN